MKAANMDASMAIAASGMAAASASLAASASQTVAATVLSGGHVTTALSSSVPGSSLAYDPSAPFANLQGMVAAPAVGPVAEALTQMAASQAFRANLAVFETASKNLKTLLDTLA